MPTLPCIEISNSKEDYDKVEQYLKNKYGKNKIKMKNLFPKHDLGKTTGYPFFMIFAFLPNGTEIFTGSMDRIQESMHDYPTCHAATYLIRKSFMLDNITSFPPSPGQILQKPKSVLQFQRYEIFGKLSYASQREIGRKTGAYKYVDIQHLNNYDVEIKVKNENKIEQKNYKKFRFGWVLPYLENRRQYFFRLNVHDKTEKTSLRNGFYADKMLFSLRHMPHHYIKELSKDWKDNDPFMKNPKHLPSVAFLEL